MSRAEAFFAELFPDAQERELVRGILAGPADGARRLVYADWLEEHGGEAAAVRAAYLRTGDEALRGQVGAEWLSAIGETRASFRRLQQQVATEWADGGWQDFLAVECDHGLLDFHYSGNTHDELLDELKGRLVDPLVAPVFRSLRIDPCGERGFANGTSTFDLDWLSEAQAEFPHLTSITLTPRGGFVISDYAEGGATGRLLRKCRALERLTTPSGPDATFFEGGPFALRALSVAAGYDHESFILNLSRSTCFPHLCELEWSDYSETYMDDWRQRTTPFGHYGELLRSPLMARLERLVLREVALSDEEVRQLLAIRRVGVTIERSREA
jgi:uncharacterized protein (TIGR02996 family)